MNLTFPAILKDTSFLLLVIAILIGYIIFFHVGSSEGLSDEAGIGMGNPFTDAACVDDSVPIITYNNSGSVSCISKDGNNCLMRDDLVPKMTTGSSGSPSTLPSSAKPNIPILCSNTGSSESGIGINTWLSAPGIRATDGITRTTFNDLNNGYTSLTCTAKGLNTSGHWCNNVYKKALENCNKPQDKIISQMNEQIRRTDVCGPDGALAKFAKTSTNSGPDVISNRFNYKEVTASKTAGPSDSTIKSCNASCPTKVARSMNKLSAAQCKTNCSNCGNATC
jgi:hypothetical protein